MIAPASPGVGVGAPAPGALSPRDPIGEAAALTRAGLEGATRRLRAYDVSTPELAGQLLRPRFALAMVPEPLWPSLDDAFWSGALAVQMVHEASLLHDDVVDRAKERRGEPTCVAEKGVSAALLVGDLYLTGAYRAATAAGSFEFVGRFAECVERTVAGEMLQGRASGAPQSIREYDAAITGKSGELFGAAALLGATVGGLGDAEERYEIGRSFGNLYQRIDDLLDYCTDAGTGKPPLQDYRQGKWSWVLGLAGVDSFDASEEEVLDLVFSPRDGAPSAARQAIEILRDRERTLLRRAGRVGASLDLLTTLLRHCVGQAERGVAEQETAMEISSRSPRPRTPFAGRASHDPEAFVRAQAERLGGPTQWKAYFGEHARTFHLAARLFPPREAGLVSGLYAYCRFTDDLVDEPSDAAPPAVLAGRLAAWRELSLSAFAGASTGLPLLDTVMAEAAARGVHRSYPEALLDGVAMDLTPRLYRSWSELERYTFGVAGAVGGWMTQLFGLHDPELLERAHALGHGMQLTNIARDVGEDSREGRSYLPTELLEAHGLSRREIARMVEGEDPIDERYRSAVRELLARADAYYEVAWPGIRALPPLLKRPVAASASAYRGIHREIRRNGYDNLSRRAHTSLPRKLVLVGAGLVSARAGAGRRAS